MPVSLDPKITQILLEIGIEVTDSTRISQEALEVLQHKIVYARCTQVALEIVLQGKFSGGWLVKEV